MGWYKIALCSGARPDCLLRIAPRNSFCICEGGGGGRKTLTRQTVIEQEKCVNLFFEKRSIRCEIHYLNLNSTNS